MNEKQNYTNIIVLWIIEIETLKTLEKKQKKNKFKDYLKFIYKFIKYFFSIQFKYNN